MQRDTQNTQHPSAPPSDMAHALRRCQKRKDERTNQRALHHMHDGQKNAPESPADAQAQNAS
jgi:hypothetical protein